MKRTLLGFHAPASVVSLVAAVVIGFVVTGCKKEEPPPPLPTAAPVTAAPAPLQLKPEDAGVKLPPDAGHKKPVYHGGGGGGGLGPCCAALQQNAMSAPPPMNAYMLQAAALCSAFAAQGKDKSAVSGMLLGALKGAGMPAACH